MTSDRGSGLMIEMRIGTSEIVFRYRRFRQCFLPSEEPRQRFVDVEIHYNCVDRPLLMKINRSYTNFLCKQQNLRQRLTPAS